MLDGGQFGAKSLEWWAWERGHGVVAEVLKVGQRGSMAVGCVEKMSRAG